MHRLQRKMQVTHSRISINLYSLILTQNILKLIIQITVQFQINHLSQFNCNISMKKKNRSNLYSVNWIESKLIIKNF
jgi:hypothetical protein